MDVTEMLKNLGESLADYTVAKNLEEIGHTLDNLAEKADDPAKKLAYRIAAASALEAALEQMVNAKAKLPTMEDEAE